MKGGNGEGYSAKAGVLNSLCRADPDFKFERACLGDVELWKKYTYKELKERLDARLWKRISVVRCNAATKLFVDGVLANRALKK